MAKRVYGNDVYAEFTEPRAQKSLKITYWDMWIAIVLVKTV